jgi:hypothetical protein
VSEVWPLIRKPNFPPCVVEGCGECPWIGGLCKLHADAKFYCTQILGQKDDEYDLTRFGR